MKPNPYDIHQPQERLRLIREVRGYLRASNHHRKIHGAAKALDGLDHVMCSGMPSVPSECRYVRHWHNFGKDQHRKGFIVSLRNLLMNAVSCGDTEGRQLAVLALDRAIENGFGSVAPLPGWPTPAVGKDKKILARWVDKYGHNERRGK